MPKVIYEKDDRVGRITLNRPEVMNAIDDDVPVELADCVARATADPGVHVIVLAGAGEAFCAGYDQSTTDKSGARHSDPKGKSHADFIEFWQRTDAERVALWTHMWRLGKPVIAAVNGWAMGGGFWYQLAADITIASDQAVFAQPEVRRLGQAVPHAIEPMNGETATHRPIVPAASTAAHANGVAREPHRNGTPHPEKTPAAAYPPAASSVPGAPAPAAGSDRVVLAFQETMRNFLDVQRTTMLAYLSGSAPGA